MTKITYERLVYPVRIVAGYIEKTNKDGRKYYNTFCRFKAGGIKTTCTDTRAIYDKQKAAENSYFMLDLAQTKIQRGEI